MDEDPQIACEFLPAGNLSVDGSRRSFKQATALHGGITARNMRTFISFRVCTKCQVVVTGSDMGKCRLIVISHTRRGFPPSFAIIFPMLLWLLTDPQDGGVALPILTGPKILW